MYLLPCLVFVYQVFDDKTLDTEYQISYARLEIYTA